MARYQSNADYFCKFDLHGCRQFYLAAAAAFDVVAAKVFRKTLALCRNDQGLVRNSLLICREALGSPGKIGKNLSKILQQLSLFV